MIVHTAVIPVAGLGTRAFPLTTAIEKSLLPVYTGKTSRPLIDFMVEDCAKAGLSRVIFVTTPRGKTQLVDYFGLINSSVLTQLNNLGRSELILAETERRNAYNLHFEYIVQPPGTYGTAVPLFLAREALKGEENFIMMGGDDFVYYPDGTSELRLAITTWEQHKTDHVIMGCPMTRQSAQKYGVLQINSDGKLETIDEKPPIERIPNHPMVNITRYLFNEKIWEPLTTEMETNRGKKEHYITYAVNNALSKGQSFQVHKVLGTYLDGGSYEGLLEASNYITGHQTLI